MPVANDVSLSDIIDSLLALNGSTLSQAISLMEKLETDLMSADTGSIQGEIEEILRIILDGILKIAETVLALQSDLQAQLVESFFPAQD